MSPDQQAGTDAGQAKDKPAMVRESVAGCVEVLDETRVAGWALRRGQPETPVEVEIRLEDRVLNKARADRFRQDLARAGIGDGKHGFNIVFETPLHPEQKSRVAAFVVCGPDGPYVPLASRSDRTTSRASKEARSGDPQDAEAGLHAALATISELRHTIDQRLAAIDNNVRSALTQFSAETKLAAQSIEAKCEELRLAQDSLGRHVSAFEVFQTRLDTALATAEEGGRRAVTVRGTGRSLTIFVSVLALVSTASLILGLISVLG